MSLQGVGGLWIQSVEKIHPSWVFFQVRRDFFFHGQDDVSVRAVDIWKQSIGKMEDTCGGRQVFFLPETNSSHLKMDGRTGAMLVLRTVCFFLKEFE